MKPNFAFIDLPVKLGEGRHWQKCLRMGFQFSIGPTSYTFGASHFDGDRMRMQTWRQKELGLLQMLCPVI